MLVLTRKAGQKFIIGKDKEIVISIIQVKGGKVSIGIDADPSKWEVIRTELLESDLEEADLFETAKEA